MNATNIFDQLKQTIWNTFCQSFSEAKNFDDLYDNFSVEYPKDGIRTDITTNIAMVFAKVLQKSPRQLFDEMLPSLTKNTLFTKIEFANPGFINIDIEKIFFIKNTLHALNKIDSFGFENVGKGLKTNVEFASPNPTGPVHIGHVRGAVYGDVVSNLLTKNGYAVTKEYYINDAGEQIKKLTLSLYIRYLQQKGENKALEEGCYPGEYLIDIAKELLNIHGVNLTYEKDFKLIKSFAIDSMLKAIKQSLANIGVKHDIYTSEQSIVDDGYVERSLKIMLEQNFLYTGTLPKPKGKSSDDWEEKEQLLFKSTLFGDDEDRVVKKSNGQNTYFSCDIGYHLHKIQRGFDKIILAMGADHLGYVKRIKAIVKSLKPSCQIDVKLCQLVKFLKNGEQIKMSKRKGTFETLDDVLDEVEPNIIRFIMVSKKNDVPMDFDLEKIKQTTKENEIFYIQYAYSRACSVLSSVNGYEANIKEHIQNANFELITQDYEINFIKKILEYPKVIQIALKNLEPHHICFYLYSLAGEFHKLWHFGNEDASKRFVDLKNQTTTNTRLLMPYLLKSVVKSAFDVIGITPSDRM